MDRDRSLPISFLFPFCDSTVGQAFLMQRPPAAVVSAASNNIWKEVLVEIPELNLISVAGYGAGCSD